VSYWVSFDAKSAGRAGVRGGAGAETDVVISSDGVGMSVEVEGRDTFGASL